MIHKGAYAIITVMLTGLFTWAGAQIFSNAKGVVRSDQHNIYMDKSMDRVLNKLDVIETLLRERNEMHQGQNKPTITREQN